MLKGLITATETETVYEGTRVMCGVRKTVRFGSTTKRQRTAPSRHPTFPVCTHATSNATICSTALTSRVSTSLSCSSTSKEFPRGTVLSLSDSSNGYLGGYCGLEQAEILA